MNYSRRPVLKNTLYASGALLLLVGSSVPASAAVVTGAAQTSSATARTGLADMSILENTSLVSTTGQEIAPNAAGNYDLALQFSGTGLADVGLVDSKVLVYVLPAELQGKVLDGATVDIQADLLPVTPADIPGIDLLFNAVELAVNVFASAVALTGTDVSGLQAAVEELKGLKNLGSYTATLPATVSGDGKALSVDFTQGLGNYFHQAYATLFGSLQTAVNGIDSANPLVEAALTILKESTDPLFKLINSIGDATSDVLNASINGNLMGTTKGTLNLTVSEPSAPTAIVRAAAIDDALLSADVLSLVETGGEAVTLNFQLPEETPTNPLEDFTVPAATFDPIHHGANTLTGNLALDDSVPAGTSFEAVTTLPNGQQIRTPIDSDGHFTIETGTVNEGESLQVQIVAVNGDFSKAGASTTVTVAAAETAPPTDEPGAGDEGEQDTDSPGDAETPGEGDDSTDEDQPTDDDGEDVEPPADDGNDLETQPDEDLDADNDGETIPDDTNDTGNDDSTVPDTDEDEGNLPPDTDDDGNNTDDNGDTPAEQPETDGDSDANDDMPPVANPDDDTTTTRPDGETEGIDIKPEGTRPPENDVSNTETGNSDSTTDSPLIDYQVSQPSLDPVKHGDVQISGTVASDATTPAQTHFETVATLPSGQQVTTTTESNGRFTLKTGHLAAGQRVVVHTVAHNNGHTRQSNPVTIIVDPAMTSYQTPGGSQPLSGQPHNRLARAFEASGQTDVAQANQKQTVAKTAQRLPQTGERHYGILAVIGGGLLIIAAALGIDKWRQR